jgi:predicted nucleotidyltransferase
MATSVSSVVFNHESLERFCRRHHIRRLSLFGSAVRGELRPDSDLDFLVEYDPAHRPGLIAVQQIQGELSELCGGRNIDILNPKYLNPRLKQRILAEAQLQYAER